MRYILTDYIERAMDHAIYESMDDGEFVGRIPCCPGVVAFSTTVAGCQRELRSVLEDWIWLGLRLGHPIPPLGGIDLSKEPGNEPVGAV